MEGVDYTDEVKEEEARSTAIEEANNLRHEVISARRALISKMAKAKNLTKQQFRRLDEIQASVDLLNKVIDAESDGD